MITGEHISKFYLAPPHRPGLSKASEQGWGTCGPWAKCGPSEHLIWPTSESSSPNLKYTIMQNEAPWQADT